jgi:RNA polymerase sigma-70 factor (ECF subfamily)
VPSLSSTAPGISDAEVLRRSISDPAQFRPVYDRHSPSVRRFLRTCTPADSVDDLCAETFVVALRRCADFRDEHGSARAWLLAIARNVARDARRRTANRHRLARLLPIPRAHEDRIVHGFGHDDLRGAELRTALERLAEADRDVLLLAALAELSYAEIAMALDIPIGTVRSRLSRARAAMRAHLTSKETVHDH